MKPIKVLARLQPATWDDESQTVDAVLSTGAGVKRRDARGEYVEFLDIDSSTVADLPPLLNSHRTASLDDLLGRVFNVRKEGGALVAKLHIDRADIAARVRSGVIRDVSIGYSITGVTERTDPKTRARSKLARVHVHEASLVVIPADKGAQVRKETPMPKKASGANPAPENVDVEQTPAHENTVAETRAEIRDIIKRAGGTSEQADELIDQDATVEQARAAAYELMTARTQSAPRVRVINPGVAPAEALEHRTEALAVRVAGGKPSDQARAFVALSLVDHARDMLEARGDRVRGMTAEAILTRAMHTVSDFPELLTGTGARLLKPAYDAASSPLVALARKMTANDFRTQSMLQLGEMPKLGKVTESGEIKSVTRGEAKESWALDTYGAIFSLSRKALINDDLNAFADFATAAGQAAANTVADLLVNALTQANGAGPVMGDTVRLFHADHGNTDSNGGQIDVESVSAARVAMMTQTGVDGSTLINVRPDTLIVAPSQLTKAEQFVADFQPITFDTTQPFKLSVVCEPRLEAVSPFDWYLADSRLPALVLGGLAGAEGPQIASRDGFEVLGREFRVTLDVGVGPNDWRGWYYAGGHSDSNSAGA